MLERLDKGEVCACLDETGSRQVEVVEQCLRCGATMDSDAVREARVEELNRADQVVSTDIPSGWIMGSNWVAYFDDRIKKLEGADDA